MKGYVRKKSTQCGKGLEIRTKAYVTATMNVFVAYGHRGEWDS